MVAAIRDEYMIIRIDILDVHRRFEHISAQFPDNVVGIAIDDDDAVVALVGDDILVGIGDLFSILRLAQLIKAVPLTVEGVAVFPVDFTSLLVHCDHPVAILVGDHHLEIAGSVVSVDEGINRLVEILFVGWIGGALRGRERPGFHGGIGVIFKDAPAQAIRDQVEVLPVQGPAVDILGSGDRFAVGIHPLETGETVIEC